MRGTPTCLASWMCSRVWGMTPSAADTTRIAPSIWAAPAIICLTKSACSGAVHVGVSPRLRLVSHAGGVDPDAAGALFGRLVDLVVRRELREAPPRTALGSALPSGWSCGGPRAQGSDVHVHLGPEGPIARHRCASPRFATFSPVRFSASAQGPIAWVYSRLTTDKRRPKISQNGAHDQDRTGDLILTKDALYRLSYAGLLLVRRRE